MPQSYTFDELVSMGAKPRAYTLEELQSLGAKPSAGTSSAHVFTEEEKRANREGRGNATVADYSKPVIPSRDRSAQEVMQDQGAAVAGGLGITPLVEGFMKWNRQIPKEEPTVAPDARTAAQAGDDQARKVLGTAGSALAAPVTVPYNLAKTALQAFRQRAGAANPEAPFWQTSANAAGQALAAAPVIAGDVAAIKAAPAAAKSLVTNASESFKNWRLGPAKAQIEQKLGPSAIERKAVTGEISDELAKRQNFVKAAKGEPFDSEVYKGFKDSEVALDAAAQQVPKGTMARKAPIVQDIKAKIGKLQVPGQIDPATGHPVMISGHPDAVKALQNALNTIEQFPDMVPFEDMRLFRQQLDQAIKTSGGWKETASAAEKAVAEANRSVANSIRAELAQAAPVMSPANAEYSLMHKAMESAGLSFEDGRRLANIGKVPASRALEAFKAAGKLGIGGYSAYKLLNILEGQATK